MKSERLMEDKHHFQLSIIIPVYNEDKNIIDVMKNIREYIHSKYEVIVVYDSIKDTTVPVVRRLQRKYKNVRLVKNFIFKGPSGAIRSGIAKVKSPRILVTMADLSDDLTQVDKMIKWVPSKFSIACPSRYSKGGEQQLNAPFKVGLPRAAGFLLRLLTGISTSDPTNSFKLYSTDFIRSISLTSTISFSVTLEIVAKAHILRKKIIEIPTVWKDRRHGKTNFRLMDSLVAYLPWFFLALGRNRLFVLPEFVSRKILLRE